MGGLRKEEAPEQAKKSSQVYYIPVVMFIHPTATCGAPTGPSAVCLVPGRALGSWGNRPMTSGSGWSVCLGFFPFSEKAQVW